MTAAPTTHRTYFDDVVVGERGETPAMTVTEAHVAVYRGLTGDADAPPGVVPDLLPLCLSTGLGWRIARPPLAVLAFMSIDWQIIRAARVGDTLRSCWRTTVKRAMRDAGVVIEEHELVDQRAGVVQRGRFTFLVAKRPVAPPYEETQH
jgi:acyl dehydratase